MGPGLKYYFAPFAAPANVSACVEGRRGKGQSYGPRTTSHFPTETRIMNTFSAKPAEVRRDWFVVDATGKTLGRLSTEIARYRRLHRCC